MYGAFVCKVLVVYTGFVAVVNYPVNWGDARCPYQLCPDFTLIKVQIISNYASSENHFSPPTESIGYKIVLKSWNCVPSSFHSWFWLLFAWTEKAELDVKRVEETTNKSVQTLGSGTRDQPQTGSCYILDLKTHLKYPFHHKLLGHLVLWRLGKGLLQ